MFVDYVALMLVNLVIAMVLVLHLFALVELWLVNSPLSK